MSIENTEEVIFCDYCGAELGEGTCMNCYHANHDGRVDRLAAEIDATEDLE